MPPNFNALSRTPSAIRSRLAAVVKGRADRIAHSLACRLPRIVSQHGCSSRTALPPQSPIWLRVHVVDSYEFINDKTRPYAGCVALNKSPGATPYGTRISDLQIFRSPILGVFGI